MMPGRACMMEPVGRGGIGLAGRGFCRQEEEARVRSYLLCHISERSPAGAPPRLCLFCARSSSRGLGSGRGGRCRLYLSVGCMRDRWAFCQPRATPSSCGWWWKGLSCRRREINRALSELGRRPIGRRTDWVEPTLLLLSIYAISRCARRQSNFFKILHRRSHISDSIRVRRFLMACSVVSAVETPC